MNFHTMYQARGPLGPVKGGRPHTTSSNSAELTWQSDFQPLGEKATLAMRAAFFHRFWSTRPFVTD